MIEPNGEPLDAEALLFTDRHGQRAQLQDVIDDGMEGGYEDRIPGLIQLQESGDPYHRLLATVMLASWGEPAGFKMLTRWANDPDHAPWAGAPVTVDRFSGADSAFETLADALRASFYSARADSIKRLQVEAARALLHASSTHYVGRTLMVAITSDRDVTASVDTDLRKAIEAGITALRQGNGAGFDLGTQTASLLVPMARLDDAAAARYAQQLMSIAPENTRMLREIAGALANGRGPDTLRLLNAMRTTNSTTLAQDVEQALARRAKS